MFDGSIEVFYAGIFYFIGLLIYAMEMSGYGDPDLLLEQGKM